MANSTNFEITFRVALLLVTALTTIVVTGARMTYAKADEALMKATQAEGLSAEVKALRDDTHANRILIERVLTRIEDIRAD